MKIAVKDANILIDLVNGDLLEPCLRLPYEFITTETVLLQLEVEEQWEVVRPYVEKGVIRTTHLSSKELENLVKDPLHSVLGTADLEVLWVAVREKGILLTGDLDLRKESQRRKVEIHGFLWILEQLIEQNLLPASQAAKSLRLVLAKGAFLPGKNCQELLVLWEK
jgi:predicted nucleic acid-binding protein